MAAIEMYMRVYKYDDETSIVGNLPVPEHPSDKAFHIKKDRVAIQQILNQNKANHWIYSY